MSVNSPVAPVVGARRDNRAMAATAGVALGVDKSARAKGPGAHRGPGVTAWQTSMRELVYFLTLGYVQPWRRARARTS